VSLAHTDESPKIDVLKEFSNFMHPLGVISV
jgi:hypothetical protein